jgi:hypothetical protein
VKWKIKVRDREGAHAKRPHAGGQAVRSAASQQLIRVDIDGDSDVFGEGQFIKRLADEAAQAHDGFAADQDVKPELAL